VTLPREEDPGVVGLVADMEAEAGVVDTAIQLFVDEEVAWLWYIG